MDQRRKVLITSIAFSIGIFGVIWWSYMAPGTVRTTWQERLDGGQGQEYSPKSNARPVYLDREATEADRRSRSKEAQTRVAPKDSSPVIIIPPDADTPDHVTVEITGTTSDHGTWNDPENQKVLGDKRWMAVESPKEAARIKEILDAPMPMDKRVTPFDRKASIELIRPDVEFCVEAARRIIPRAKGRLVVSYDLNASGGTAVVQNAVVDPIIGFEGVVGLAECIVDRIQGRTFDASRDGEVLRVEYPFFFD